MTNQEKLHLLEEIMELDEGTLKEDMILSDIDEWDSISLLSFMAMLDEKFSKNITGSEVKVQKTVGDLMSLMENEHA